MANVLNKTTLEYRPSVHTPDFPSEEWLINPDLSQVKGVDPAYWVLDGPKVVPMTEEQRAAKDQQLAEAAKAEAVESARDETGRPLVKALAVVIANELTLIRKQAGLGDRTNEEIVQSILTALEGV